MKTRREAVAGADYLGLSRRVFMANDYRCFVPDDSLEVEGAGLI